MESCGHFGSSNTYTFVENDFNRETSSSLSFGTIYYIIIAPTRREYRNGNIIAKQNRTFEEIFFPSRFRSILSLFIVSALKTFDVCSCAALTRYPTIICSRYNEVEWSFPQRTQIFILFFVVSYFQFIRLRKS